MPNRIYVLNQFSTRLNLHKAQRTKECSDREGVHTTAEVGMTTLSPFEIEGFVALMYSTLKGPLAIWEEWNSTKDVEQSCYSLY